MPPALQAFSTRRERGKGVESTIARYLRSRGNAVLPMFTPDAEAPEGPRLILPEGSGLATPDLLIFSLDGQRLWVECKSKAAASWHRLSRQWTVSVNRRHWQDYGGVAAYTDIPVWLLFLIQSSEPTEADKIQGCPPECPTGLFGRDLPYLAAHVSHEHEGHPGTIWWALPDLKAIATLEELRNC